MRYVERVAEAAWEQGQRRPFYISNWMAVTLRTRLTKDNLTLAHKLLDLYAAAQMVVTASGERNQRSTSAARCSGVQSSCMRSGAMSSAASTLGSA